jgi:hypothetical protein
MISGNYQITKPLHGTPDPRVFDLYFSPEELGSCAGEGVEYDSVIRSHEAIDMITQSDKYLSNTKKSANLELKIRPTERK